MCPSRFSPKPQTALWSRLHLKLHAQYQVDLSCNVQDAAGGNLPWPGLPLDINSNLGALRHTSAHALQKLLLLSQQARATQTAVTVHACMTLMADGAAAAVSACTASVLQRSCWRYHNPQVGDVDWGSMQLFLAGYTAWQDIHSCLKFQS